MTRQSACALNLRRIVQAMNVYAGDNNDMFPAYVPSSATTYDVTFKGDKTETAASAEAGIAQIYKDKLFSTNPSAGLWLLVLRGDVAAKQFICPSDPFANVPAKLNTGGGESAVFLNFQGAKNISYSTA